MNQQSPKIAFYTKRSFSEKISATFDFLKKNWKVILKYTTFLILPVSILQALILNKVVEVAFKVQLMQKAGEDSWEMLKGTLFKADAIASYGLILLCTVVGSILLTSLLYALMQVYNEHEEGLKGITFSDFKIRIIKNAKRFLYLIPFFLGIMIVAYAILFCLILITPVTLFLTIPLLLVCAVPLALFTPIYIFEDISIMRAFIKSFRLGFATWGGIFAIGLLFGVIVYILSVIASVPWYVAFMVKQVFIFSDVQSGITVSVGYGVILYIFAVIQTFGSYLAEIFIETGLAYQYSHAREKIDHISSKENTDNFEQQS
jgi:hypothetical protein